VDGVKVGLGMPEGVVTREADAEEKTRTLVASLWIKSRPTIEARVELLERASVADPLGDELRAEAHSVAHKLAGSLGMFGFPEGTRVARELELRLEISGADPAVLADLTKQLREILFPAS